MHPLFDQRRYLIPFRSSLLPQIFTDTLVIGTGVAGLRAAIAAAECGEVIILSKDGTEESNTAWAQGGIAAVMSREDTIESHIQDTLTAGAGLCDEPAVRAICAAAPERMRELAAWGMRFDKSADSDIPHLNREGGHAHARILHADGDATGKELARCLVAKLAATSHVRLFTNCFSLDLITPSGEPGAPVMGAITHHPRYGLQMIWAKSTILATGGAGMVYRETTNPKCATADGMAMAYRAGAAVQDMAFVQFHPTTLYLAGRPRSLITEAVRGAGAYLLDHSGARFMVDVHPMAELAPRDVVSRAIVHRLATHGGTHVFLDVRHIERFRERFPGITALLKGVDLDPSKDLIPVNPAAHYTIGGVATDMIGRSSVPGLFAVGEVASCGLHGANRLASNSLLEGLVLGEAAGREAARIARLTQAGMTSQEAATWPVFAVEAGQGGQGGQAASEIVFRPPPSPVPVISDIRPSDNAELDLSDVLSSLRSAMWRNAGVERSGPRLADVAEMIDFWARYTLDKIFDSPPGWQAQNMLLVAALIARSALWRAESRGGHVRMDCGEMLEGYRVHDRVRRGVGEVVKVGVQTGKVV
jgi:L-aspartate oxidase